MVDALDVNESQKLVSLAAVGAWLLISLEPREFSLFMVSVVMINGAEPFPVIFRLVRQEGSGKQSRVMWVVGCGV